MGLCSKHQEQCHLSNTQQEQCQPQPKYKSYWLTQLKKQSRRRLSMASLRNTLQNGERPGRRRRRSSTKQRRKRRRNSDKKRMKRRPRKLKKRRRSLKKLKLQGKKCLRPRRLEPEQTRRSLLLVEPVEMPAEK